MLVKALDKLSVTGNTRRANMSGRRTLREKEDGGLFLASYEQPYSLHLWDDHAPVECIKWKLILPWVLIKNLGVNDSPFHNPRLSSSSMKYTSEEKETYKNKTKHPKRTTVLFALGLSIYRWAKVLLWRRMEKDNGWLELLKLPILMQFWKSKLKTHKQTQQLKDN